MSRTEITVQECPEWNCTSEEFTAGGQAVDTTDGAEFAMPDGDQKYTIKITNGNSAKQTLTIMRGNGIQGVYDMVIPITAGKSVIVGIESGHFKNVTGEDKGKVIMTSTSDDVKVEVYKLP